MDILSEILATVRMRGSLYFQTEFTPPWGILVPKFLNVARYHLVLRGTCCVTVKGVEQTVWLKQGDLVVIPHGAEHKLSDAIDTEAYTVDRVVELAGFTGEGCLVYGGGDNGEQTRLLCGHFEFDQHACHPLLKSLPPFIHVKAIETMDYSWLSDALRFITHEVNSKQPGSNAIINRLSEILFIQTIRDYQRRSSQTGPGLAGLTDPKIGHALWHIHRHPEKAWTTEELADLARLSRTRFSVRFRELVGLPPLEYITKWRMLKARQLLSETSLTIQQIAGQVGYRSESAFSRVFTKHFKKAPGLYRRTI